MAFTPWAARDRATPGEWSSVQFGNGFLSDLRNAVNKIPGPRASLPQRFDKLFQGIGLIAKPFMGNWLGGTPDVDGFKRFNAVPQPLIDRQHKRLWQGTHYEKEDCRDTLVDGN